MTETMPETTTTPITAPTTQTATATPTDAPISAPVRVAYLVSKYPALSHAFIEREILSLRERGVEVHTFSVRPCPPEELKSADMRAEAARTTVLIDADKKAAATTYAKIFRDSLQQTPNALLSGLRTAAGNGDSTAKARVWQGFYFAEAVRLYQEMKARDLRHVHVHFANVGADVARLVVAIGEAADGPDAGWRWSFTMHGPTEFENVDKVDLPAKVESASGVACITDFCRSQLMRLVDPAHWDKLGIVHMSVDTARYAPPAEGRRRADGEPLRLLYVGRLVPEKGGPVLLDAVSRLTQQGVPVQLRMIGGGELMDRLRTQITELGIGDQVTLMGPVGQDDLPQWYHWADVFVLPSFQEGLPVVLMEALSTGLPVVTTRIAGIPELVEDGVMGRVVTPGRADLLADAIAGLADGSTGGPDRREEQGRAGRAAVEAGFTSAEAAAEMHAFLAGVR